MLAACTGCGGGASPSSALVSLPTPPAQDFSIALSSNAITIMQGVTSSALSISVSGQNGFNGVVQVTLGRLPGGVLSNPVSPFSGGSEYERAGGFGSSGK